MTGWLARLPIHRKLVAMALFVTVTALLLTTAVFIALDSWRYRVAAIEDVSSLANMLAATTTGAIAFNDPDEARRTLTTAEARPNIIKTCAYLAGGELFAAYEPTPARPCAQRLGRGEEPGLLTIAIEVPIRRSGGVLGAIYVEEDLSDIKQRIAVGLLGALATILLAGGLAFAVAQRLHRTVSTPIALLAQSAEAFTIDQELPSLPVDSTPDEVGRLVNAFDAMVHRIRESGQRLQETNQALQREIDERRLMEAEREKLLIREREASRLKDEFLAAVSHELRTPLNAILGWVQVLTTTSPEAETASRAFASIARNASLQTRVIEDLVDVSRIVTGKFTLHTEAMDVRAPIEAAIDVVRPSLLAKNISLDVDLPAEPYMVHGDPDRLQQVVWNLLSNAAKFTPAGGRVSVALTRDDDACEIRVSDTGKGITPDFLPHVFDRFRQADGSLIREHGGLGLGLSIVKEITELHGGVVTAASAGAGCGASFVVRLPRPLVAAMPDAARPARRGAPRLTGVSVLAVDDNPDSLDVMTAVLGSAGATVRACASGAAAIAEWKRAPADVLVCDLAMPGLSGYDVLQEIRAHDARAGRHTGAIAVTAYGAPGNIEASRAAGFSSHLVKPFAAEELVRLVHNALRTT